MEKSLPNCRGCAREFNTVTKTFGRLKKSSIRTRRGEAAAARLSSDVRGAHCFPAPAQKILAASDAGSGETINAGAERGRCTRSGSNADNPYCEQAFPQRAAGDSEQAGFLRN